MNEQIITGRPTFPAQLDMSHPLTKGLIGCWVMNETGGMRAFDSSPYGNHGRNNTATIKSSTFGKLFNGTSDNISIPQKVSQSIVGKSGVTLIVGYGNCVVSGANQRFISLFNGAGSARLSIILTATQGVASSIIRSGTEAAQSFNSPLVGTTNGSHFYATTIDLPTQQIKVFLDGQSATSGTLSFASTTFQDTTNTIDVIGSSSGAEYFGGIIHFIYMFTRVFSLSEIKQLYADPYEIFLK